MSVPETISCIFDPSKKCGHPDKLTTSATPKVFILSSTENTNVVNWFKETFEKHVRAERKSKFKVVFFTDPPTWDFCDNVCIPIHESWFCVAIIKEELLPQHTMRKNTKLLTGYTTRLNPNVLFEVGLALSREKVVIIYKGYHQDLPSDWNNLMKYVLQEPSIFLSPEDNETLKTRLRDIIMKNPFIGHSVKWI